LDVVGNIWWGAKELEPYADDSRIRVHGFVPRAVLLDFYRTAHALVIPSLYEGFGLPAAEAINSGCLALTSSGSAFDEYIPTGCRFDPQDGARLTRLIEDMGIESCERLWQESFQAVARYTLEAQTDAYQVVFSELVKHVKK
jgi:glycosyltransferase involved in cell wall biosynthesis